MNFTVVSIQFTHTPKNNIIVQSTLTKFQDWYVNPKFIKHFCTGNLKSSKYDPWISTHRCQRFFFIIHRLYGSICAQGY